MLLLPLVENSFKHGLKSGVINPFLKIYFEEKNGNFHFNLKNNFKKKKKENMNGIGLKNIEKNLELIYQNKFKFRTEIIDNIFIVDLKIDLK